MNEARDEELMGDLARGNLDTFDVLFSRHAPRVIRFLRRYFRQADVAEDLAQETFLKLFRGRASFDPSRPFLPWLYAIAWRLMADEKRRASRGIVDLDREGEPEREGAQVDVVESLLDDHVTEALGQLTSTERDILFLHQAEGLTYREIADVFGLTPDAVKLRAFRALTKLREATKGVQS